MECSLQFQALTKESYPVQFLPYRYVTPQCGDAPSIQIPGSNPTRSNSLHNIPSNLPPAVDPGGSGVGVEGQVLHILQEPSWEIWSATIRMRRPCGKS